MAEITKEQFYNAYNNHLPNKWIKFAYKYFSKETEKEDMTLNNIVYVILALTFLIGFVGTIFDFSERIIGLATLGYSSVLIVLGIYLYSVSLLNNLRIDKIVKELGISKEEYLDLVGKFYS